MAAVGPEGRRRRRRGTSQVTEERQEAGAVPEGRRRGAVGKSASNQN